MRNSRFANNGSSRIAYEAYGNIRALTLIMYGDADAVVDPRNSKLLASRISSSQVVAFPGLGHLFFWEEPAQFTKAVTSFLLAPAEKALNGSDEGQSRGARNLR